MNRIVGIFSAMLLGLFVLVQVAAAAQPARQDEHLIFSTGGDIVIPTGQHVDLLVVVGGTATIQGDADSLLLIDGTAHFVGSRTEGIVAIRSHVVLDAGSVVAGDIRTIDSAVERAPGATVRGNVIEGLGVAGVDLAGGAALVGSALFLAYLGFSIATIFAGLAIAALASRQVRSAEAMITNSPLKSFGAGLAGLIAILGAGIAAIVTIVGIPLGFGILVGLLPMLLIVGYLVAGIWIGERIVRPTSPGVIRDRPYVAAIVGIALLDLVSIVPVVGAIASFLGFGAVVLLMWRIFWRTTETASAVTPAASPSAG
jgi:hypothetical protein